MKDFQGTFRDLVIGAWPQTKAKNASGPLATDGTPYTDAILNDMWGAIQAIMYKANFTPNGMTETYLSSQILNALEAITINLIKTKAIPIGSLYMQLPNESDPGSLWTGTTWNDVSSSYAGAFFRVVGGNAASFGSKQTSQNAAHSHGAYCNFTDVGHSHYLGRLLTDVASMYQAYFPMQASTETTEWRTPHTALNHNHGVTINQSGGNESRPENYSIRIWKRTA